MYFNFIGSEVILLGFSSSNCNKKQRPRPEAFADPGLSEGNEVLSSGTLP